MAVVQCSKGHFYDNKKYEECPHCKNGIKITRREDFRDNFDEIKTQGLLEVTKNDDSVTDIFLVEKGSEDIEGKTIGQYNFENGTKWVVGWLVCICGKAKGRDYRIYHGWNRIGRGMSMNIYIPEDKKIAKENQAAIIFDEKSSEFYCSGDYGSLTYLNDNPLNKTEVLKSGDEISMGESKFVFIAFCTEDRKW